MAETEKGAEASASAAPQPGSTITPAAASLQTPSPATSQTAPPDASAKPKPETVPTKQPSAAPDLFIAPQPAPSAAASDPDGAITWTASEFVAHEKSAGWYAALAGGTVVVAGLIYLLTKDIISTAVVVIGAVFLGIYAKRKPRQLQYRLDDSGISVGDKQYQYEEFRSFGVVPEGAFSSIVFLPLKRFAPTTSIYYAPEDEDDIVEVLSDRLPFQEYGHDVVDQFMRRIRF